jgi:hypothetical protein
MEATPGEPPNQCPLTAPRRPASFLQENAQPAH